MTATPQRMSQNRGKMIEALRQIITPKLRDAGFKGSFPHFRRLSSQQIDLLMFQFDKWGGGFVIEIAKCPPDGFTTSWGEYILPNKVRAWDLHPAQRLRLQPREGSSRKEWFRFDRSPFDRQTAIFAKTAEAVLPFLDIAEAFWKAPPDAQTNGTSASSCDSANTPPQ